MRNHVQAETESAISQINVTPLVDVMLCLLIIFMIAAPTLTRSLPFDLPQKGPIEDTRKPESPMQLRILADGRLLLDGKPIQDDVLAAELSYQAGRDDQRILSIDADRPPPRP